MINATALRQPVRNFYHALRRMQDPPFARGMEILDQLHTHESAEKEMQCLHRALAYFRKAARAGDETPALQFAMLKCLSFLGRIREYDVVMARYYASRKRDPVVVAFEKKDYRYLPAACVHGIGCMGFLTTYIMAGTLSKDLKPFLVLAPEGKAVNESYLSYYAPYIRRVSDETQIEALRQERSQCEMPIDWGMEFQGETLNIHWATTKVSRAWHAEGRGPLLTLRQEHRERGEEALRAHGIDPKGWFVCLHVRTSGFHGAGRDTEPSRNADIETYRKAVAEIVARGGKVFRMGDPSMPPFEAEGVIDYVHSPLRSDWMDVYLLAACRFFLGTTSGPHRIPFSFGVPCVQTNATPPALFTFSIDDIVVPKLIRSKKTGRMLPFRQIFDEPYGTAVIRYLCETLDIEFVDNTEDDILAAVKNMLGSFEGGTRVVPELTPLQRQFNVLLESLRTPVAGQLDASFLMRHAALF